MEGHSFDRFAKTLANGSTRRGFLHGLFGRGASVAVASIAGAAAIGAVRPDVAQAAGTCPGDKIPTGCACESGLSECSNDTCKDLQSDEQNCGSCGNVCSAGLSCVDGVCSCPSGQTNCNGTCVDLQTDVNNCAQCGRVCEPNKLCQSGSCVCPSEMLYCYNGTANNCFSPIGPEYCESCTQGMTTGMLCCGGVAQWPNETNCSACGDSCGSGEMCCNGACTSVVNNDDHCGNCTNVCVEGYGCCNTSCFDFQSNRPTCGDCNTSCGSNEVCQAGVCVECSAGYTRCGNDCVNNFHANNNHCGGCGIVCSGGMQCIGSYCQWP